MTTHDFCKAAWGGRKMTYSTRARELRQCTATRKDGQACGAWAVWGEPDQLCVSHSSGTRQDRQAPHMTKLLAGRGNRCGRRQLTRPVPVPRMHGLTALLAESVSGLTSIRGGGPRSHKGQDPPSERGGRSRRRRLRGAGAEGRTSPRKLTHRLALPRLPQPLRGRPGASSKHPKHPSYLPKTSQDPRRNCDRSSADLKFFHRRPAKIMGLNIFDFCCRGGSVERRYHL